MNGPDVPPFEFTGREFLPPLPRVTWRSARRNLVLFVLTAISVFSLYGFTVRQLPGGGEVYGVDWSTGLSFTGAVFAILLAHEFGHYFAARHHGVDTSLPYFIPFPLGLAGTLGAFIRIRTPIPNRRALFDIGASGPLAGMLVCLPVLVLGVLEGRWVPIEGSGEGPGYLGEPLIFQWAVALLKDTPPEHATLQIGPLGMAAWFGLLVTALNLMPVGQLDGGHTAHALLQGRAAWISRLGIVACLVLLYRRPSWLLWTILLLVFARRPHPPTLVEALPIGRGRIWVGLLTLVVFVVCFTPSPVLVSWPELLESLGFTSR